MKKFIICFIFVIILLLSYGCHYQNNNSIKDTEPSISLHPPIDFPTTPSDTQPIIDPPAEPVTEPNVKPTEEPVTEPVINKCEHVNSCEANCINESYCWDCQTILGPKNPKVHPANGAVGLYDIREANCIQEGYTGDLKCKSCYGVIEYGQTIPVNNNHYTFYYENKATCVKLATCEICNKHYGDYDINRHEYYITKNKTEATCLADGYSGDVCCADCDMIIRKGEVVKGRHKADIPTCVGTYCSVCNNKASDSIITTEHNKMKHLEETLIGEIIPTHPCQSGYTGDLYCSACNKTLKKGQKIEATQEHNQEVREIIQQIAPCCTGYSGNIYCSVCDIRLQDGKTIRPTISHTWSTKYLHNPDAVQNTCARCQSVETTTLLPLDIAYVGKVDSKLYFEPVNNYTGTGRGYTKLTYEYITSNGNGAWNSSGATYVPLYGESTVVIAVTISEYTNNVNQKSAFRKVTKYFDTSTNTWQ